MSDTNQEPYDALDAARDRLTDRLLAEALGDETPPDQSEAILARAADERAMVDATTERPSRRRLLLAFATAAAILIAFVVSVPEIDQQRVALQDRTDSRIVERGSRVPAAAEWTPGATSRNQSALAPNAGEAAEQRIERLDDTVGYLAASSPPEPTPPAAPAPRSGLAGSEVTAQLRQPKSALARTESGARRAVSTAPAELGDVASRRFEIAPSRFGFRDGFGGGGQGGGGGYFRAATVDSDSRSTPRGRLGLEFSIPRPVEPLGRDRYAAITENEFITPIGGDALSTFSVDVDTASYSNVRQQLLDQRRLPPKDAVRIEELINYFDYADAPPAADSEAPFNATMSLGVCPWRPEHRLVRIGIRGREIDTSDRPPTNLVFLVDVSGSMNSPQKLPLVVEGLTALTNELTEDDRVAIVVYAGSEGVVLPSTSGDDKQAILVSLDRLRAGGSTAGGAGLKLAYEIAERNRVEGGVNRVVLCTDGDFNVGLTGTEELAKLVETRRKETGVFLTVLGFGRGNLNDAMLEAISGRGDGNYFYIADVREARRVLAKKLSGTLVAIAKDVKLQVEFNPAVVAQYRLVGYENRLLAAQDFNDDTKDAGEIGAGHTVTALYEIVPVGVTPPDPPVDGLKYQTASEEEPTSNSQQPTAPSTELLTLKIRYKQPEGGASTKLEFPLENPGDLEALRSQETIDFRWASAVAEFGMLLRGSRHAGEATYDAVLERARTAIGDDPSGERAEFLDLVRAARDLTGSGR